MSSETTPNADLTYTVPDMTCGHCKAVVSDAVNAVGGVVSVDVNLDTHRVVVGGSNVSDVAVRNAIDAAGYEVARS